MNAHKTDRKGIEEEKKNQEKTDEIIYYSDTLYSFGFSSEYPSLSLFHFIDYCIIHKNTTIHCTKSKI